MFLRAFASLVFVVPTAAADPFSEGAIPHAERLIARMQAFDAEGILALTHIQAVERLGMSAEQLRQAMLDANRQASGARFASFELGSPTDSFQGPDGVYTLIPYTCLLEVDGQRIRQEAFFIAVTGDDGATWRFLDGVMTNRVPVEAVVPGYTGPPLPSLRRVRESN